MNAQEPVNQRSAQPAHPTKAGPYLTISRQYGCWGFALAALVADVLNETADEQHAWKIYGKDILTKLAEDIDSDAETLERERRTTPGLLTSLVRTLSGSKIPSGFEIRNRVAEIIRKLAIDGRAIILGRGGAMATWDIPHGLSIRLEAPKAWRVHQVMFREGLTEMQARMLLLQKDQEREELRRIYELRCPRQPMFDMMFDCSQFTLAQIAQVVVYAMRVKGYI